MPRAFGYCRVSHSDSAESGLSIAEQIEQITNYFNYIRTRPGNQDLVWGGMFEDPGKSAFKKHFLKRPESFALMQALEDGDHVMFYKLDRGFRNVRDLTRTVETWEKRNIRIHFIDLNVDVSTANGKFFMHIVGAVSEWFSAVKSEVLKGAMKQLRKQHWRPQAGKHHWGWKIVVRNGVRTRVPNEEERALMQFCLKRHLEKATVRQICEDVEAILSKFEGRSHRPYAFQKVTRHMVDAMIKAELRLQQEEADAAARLKALHDKDRYVPPADKNGCP